MLEGKLAEAEGELTQALATSRRGLGDRHPLTLEALTLLAMVRGATGESLAREAVDAWRATRPRDWRAFFAQCVLGSTLLAQKKPVAAAPLLREGIAGLLAHAATIGAPDHFLLERAKGWVAPLPER